MGQIHKAITTSPKENTQQSEFIKQRRGRIVFGTLANYPGFQIFHPFVNHGSQFCLKNGKLEI